MSVDLRTNYLGLHLSSPLVASAGPLTGRIDTLERLAAAGAAAVVLPSLFEEDVTESAFDVHRWHEQGAGVFAEATNSYLPEIPGSGGDPDRHLDLVERAVRALDIPVIASLNGTTRGGWLRYAEALVEAGAAALELNVYVVAADPADTAASVETQLIHLVTAVRDLVDVPIAVKLSPYFTALGDVCRRMVHAGADALVLFNRFYQPDLDLDLLDVSPTLELSTPSDLRLPLRWIGILHGETGAGLALSGGVHSGADVVKAIAAGADVVMSTSALLKHGPNHLAALRRGLVEWLDDHDYESVDQLRGSMCATAVPDPDAYERANYRNVVRRATARYTTI
ncbi:MAG: dihydroorotate dehydrogenase-like protein [Acidimicrobiia bacterium]